MNSVYVVLLFHLTTMSEVYSLEDSDSEESLVDHHTGGLYNVFSVDQLIAQQREEETGHCYEGEGLEAQYSTSFSSSTEASPSSYSCSKAGLSNLHDINELSALSSLATVEEEVEEEVVEEEEEEDVEGDYSLDDFEPGGSDNDDEGTTAISSMHTSSGHGDNKGMEITRYNSVPSASACVLPVEDLREEEEEEKLTQHPDHSNRTHCCSVSVQTDPAPTFTMPPHTGGGRDEGGWSHILGQHTVDGEELQILHKASLISPSLPSLLVPAVTTSSPTKVLHHLISSQLVLTQQLMGQTLQLARSLTSTITPSYHYTTLQETKQVRTHVTTCQ